MDNLAYELKGIAKRNRDGGYGTRKDRESMLILIAKELKQLGFKHMRAGGIKPKHVDALVDNWNEKGLKPGTVKNRMAAIRWWAEKVGKPEVVPSNRKCGIPNREYVPNKSKAEDLMPVHLSKISCQNVSYSLRLQYEFGLRREEAIKFMVSVGDRGSHIYLKGSWCKGGREREVPITNMAQRKLLDELHQFCHKSSLVPAGKNYIQQRNVFDAERINSGLSGSHTLRHSYAQRRYTELTGFKAPVCGGKKWKNMSPEERCSVFTARTMLRRELGHGRESIVSIYLGR